MNKEETQIKPEEEGTEYYKYTIKRIKEHPEDCLSNDPTYG